MMDSKAGAAFEVPLWRDERGDTCWYRLHRDGRVAAYDYEVQAGRRGLWRATAWSKDPRVHDDAASVHLVADATRAQLDAALAEWAGEDD